MSALKFSTTAPKCPICSKSVYKMEEIQALNKTWHKACFTCGASKGDGCGRTLSRDGYLDHGDSPYCNACYGRLFRPKGVGFGANLSTASAAPSVPPAPSSTNVSQVGDVRAPVRRPSSGGSAGIAAMLSSTGPGAGSTSQVSVPSVPAPAPSDATSPSTATTSVKVGASFSSTAPKCPICSKSVYKMEEIQALNKTWHKACFTCGASKGDGCGRTLSRDGYLDHGDSPYCNACYGRLFRPKGVGFGANLSTASAAPSVPPAPSSTNVSQVGDVRAPVRRPSSGGSAGIAAMLSSTGPGAGSTSQVSVPSVPAPAPSDATSPSTATTSVKVGASFSSTAPKCPICSKSVYKMEEIQALNKTWHKACFTCGASKGDGCGRTLSRDGYLDHGDSPYCNACYGRLFRPKGVGFGANLSTASAAPSVPPAPSSTNVSQVGDVRAPVRRPSSGGSAGIAAMLSSTGPGAGSTSQVSVPSVPAPAPSDATSPSTATTSVTVGASFSSTAPKCPICSKSVYKMEEIQALNKTWHKACFTCGASKGDGCGRTLSRDGYLDHGDSPYCNACYGRLFRPKGVGFGANLSTASAAPSVPPAPSSTNVSQVGDVRAPVRRPSSGGSAGIAAMLSSTGPGAGSTSQVSVQSVPAPAPSDATSPSTATTSVKVGASFSSTAPKCPICSKSVYKMEEIQALNKTWHKACFTCGALKGDGCGRTLSRDGYLDHGDSPYCNACYGRLFRPKGVGFGANLSTASADPNVLPAPSSTNVSQVGDVRAPVRRPSSGGSAGIAAMLSSTSGVSSQGVLQSSALCKFCGRAVYKNEEVIYLNEVVHTACFRCGAGSKPSLGCNRLLKHGTLDYSTGSKIPFCNSCFTRLHQQGGHISGSSLAPSFGGQCDIKVVTEKIEAFESEAQHVVAARAAKQHSQRKSSIQCCDLNVVSTLKGQSGSGASKNIEHKEEYVGNGDEVDDSEW